MNALSEKKEAERNEVPARILCAGKNKKKPLLEFNAKNVKTRQKGVAFAYAHCTLSA